MKKSLILIFVVLMTLFVSSVIIAQEPEAVKPAQVVETPTEVPVNTEPKAEPQEQTPEVKQEGLQSEEKQEEPVTQKTESTQEKTTAQDPEVKQEETAAPEPNVKQEEPAAQEDETTVPENKETTETPVTTETKTEGENSDIELPAGTPGAETKVMTIVITGTQNSDVYDEASHKAEGFSVSDVRCEGMEECSFDSSKIHFDGEAKAERSSIGITWMELSADQFSYSDGGDVDVRFEVIDGYQEIREAAAEPVVIENTVSTEEYINKEEDSTEPEKTEEPVVVTPEHHEGDIETDILVVHLTVPEKPVEETPTPQVTPEATETVEPVEGEVKETTEPIEGEGKVEETVEVEVKETTEPVEGEGEVKENTEPVEGEAELKETVEPVEGEGEVKETTEPVEGEGEVKETTEPVEGEGEVKETAEPVESEGEVKETVEPVESEGEVKETVEPVEGEGEVKETTEPVEGEGEVKETVEPVEGEFSVISSDGQLTPAEQNVELTDQEPTAEPTAEETPAESEPEEEVKTLTLAAEMSILTDADEASEALLVTEGELEVVILSVDENGWAMVELPDGSTGYIQMPAEEADEETPAEEETETPEVEKNTEDETPKTYLLGTDIVIYAGTDAESEVIFTAEEDLELTVLSVDENGWALVELPDGSTGYVQMPVEEEPAVETNEDETPKTYLLTANMVIYAGTDAESEVIFTAEEDLALTILSVDENGWALVELPDGSTGYVLTIVEKPEEEKPLTATIAPATNIRVAADGMSVVMLIPDADMEVIVLGQEGDWVKVQLEDGTIGYIYINDIEFEGKEPKVYTEKKVTIFTTLHPMMSVNEPITLTSLLEGFEDCVEISYQWKCDKGNGFEDVEGATGDSYTYEATADSLTWSWQLVVSYN